ncbi:hypothetical protein FRB96_000923 [Tulasnella sp. 330]|nr:hypothetical protein FRB96_000923 [Tulasnella sp. 330]KAG8873860.1 hypothetical protein FRB97_006381 [Tulasnella sp. 331]
MSFQTADHARLSYSQELAKHTLQQWNKARMEAAAAAAAQSSPTSNGRDAASAASPFERVSVAPVGPPIKVVDFAQSGRGSTSGYIRTPVEAL